MRSASGFKRRFGVLLAALAIAITLVSGCGNGGEGGNGGGSTAGGGGPAGGDEVVAGRVSFMFDDKQYSGTTCTANSLPDGNSTSINVTGARGWSLMLEIPGVAAGTFNEKDGAKCSLLTPPSNVYTSETITITLSSYGKVGGSVKGTFSGMLVHYVDSTRKPITDGTFKAHRHLNVE